MLKVEFNIVIRTVPHHERPGFLRSELKKGKKKKRTRHNVRPITIQVNRLSQPLLLKYYL